MKHTSFRIKPELLEALQIRAKAEQRSVNQLINMVLQASLDVPQSAAQMPHNVPQSEAQANTSNKGTPAPIKVVNNASKPTELKHGSNSAASKRNKPAKMVKQPDGTWAPLGPIEPPIIDDTELTLPNTPAPVLNEHDEF